MDLGNPDIFRPSAGILKQPVKITDNARRSKINAYYKGRPDLKKRSNINLNGKYPCSSTDTTKAVCAHFSGKLMTQKDRKPSLTRLFDPALLPGEGLGYGTPEYQAFIRTASTHLIRPAELGTWIVQSMKNLEQMPLDVGQPQWMRAMVITNNHGMVITLEVKKYGDPPTLRYVVRLFDPNTTHEESRLATDNLAELQNLQLRDLLPGDLYGSYTKEMPEALAISTTAGQGCANFESSQPRSISELSQRLWIGLRQKATKKEIDSTLSEIDNRLHSPVAIREFFQAFKGQGGIPGLYFALENGHPGAVDRLLKLAKASGIRDENFWKELLLAKDPNAVPVMYFALANGHADAVEKLLQQAAASGIRDESFWKELLLAKDPNGVPGMYFALVNGHADTVEKLLQLPTASGIRDESFWKALLLAKNSDGIPGMYFALANGHADTVEKLLQLATASGIRDESFWKELLLAKDPNGVPGMYFALVNGHADAVEKLLQLAKASGIRDESLWKELLLAKNSNGVPGMCFALVDGHADAVEKLLQLAAASGIRHPGRKFLEKTGPGQIQHWSFRMAGDKPYHEWPTFKGT
ncbi:hypothetical protein AWB78_07923 [Caballeronia calidae]|uniref:ShET2 enterotoxin N-terminal domain-containing protein n=2 Tax=Caballeronia calidae TaxID=1777139 RepID=A0A158EH47_9BURK|nr:hypothetical protein AWB78_07923 [Caballeronia calidae]